MLIWLEKFVMAVCAASFVALVLLNLVKFDLVQRLSLAVALAAFALFVGRTIATDRPLSRPSTISEKETELVALRVKYPKASLLDPSEPARQTVGVYYLAQDPKQRASATVLVRILKNADWPVDGDPATIPRLWVNDLIPPPFTGIGLIVRDENDLPATARALRAVFASVGIPVTVIPREYQRPIDTIVVVGFDT